MEEEVVPRRLRRFYREKERQKPSYKRPRREEIMHKAQEEPSQQEERELTRKEMKKKTVELALKEIKNFKEKNRRLPKGKEYDEIAEAIFKQMKRSREAEKIFGKIRQIQGMREEKALRLAGRRAAGKEEEQEEAPKAREELQRRRLGRRESFEERRKKRRGRIKEGPAAKPALAEETAGLSVEELFKEEPGKEEESLSISDLEGSDFDFEKELGLGELDEGIGKEIQTNKNKCPTCGIRTDDIVFCPHCGTAFCSHCAKKVQVLEDKVKYVCPKCGGEFKTRKT